MMRNVAIGAVLGFGLVVLLLSIFNNEAPPQAPPPVVVAEGDAGAPALIPLNVGPVILVPQLKDQPPDPPPPAPGRRVVNDSSRSDAVLRGRIDELQRTPVLLDIRDASVP
jgi:hypothetical protein